MSWTITSLLEKSNTVENKGGLSNCLRIADTKAWAERGFQFEDVWSRENQDVD
jgi:hypothetical protein